MTMSVFSLTVAPPREGIERLHDMLLRHPRIRDAASEICYSYIVKCAPDVTAGELADLVTAALPGNQFLVAQLHHERIAGFLSDATRDWMETSAPPPRGADHKPDGAAILRLPLLAGLQAAARIVRQSQRLLETQEIGRA